MRFELLVLILFVGVRWAYGDGDGDQLDGGNDDKGRNNNEERRVEDKRDDYGKRGDIYRDGNRGDRDYDSNYDDDHYIYYPCDFEDDIDCIRHYFASSGQCKGVHNYGRKPVYRHRLVTYLPGYNVTIVLNKSRIKYIRDRISRFYINKKTQNLVMAVDFEGINIDTKLAYFIYQRRGQEPIKRADYTNGTFPVTLTAVIPLEKSIDFKYSRVTAYLPSVPDKIDIGPKILASTDPLVIQVNTAIFANLPQAVLELFLTEAPSLYYGYLQKYICDFGIPISS